MDILKQTKQYRETNARRHIFDKRMFHLKIRYYKEMKRQVQSFEGGMENIVQGMEPRNHNEGSDIEAFKLKDQPRNSKLKYKDIVEIGMSWKKNKIHQLLQEQAKTFRTLKQDDQRQLVKSRSMEIMRRSGNIASKSNVLMGMPYEQIKQFLPPYCVENSTSTFNNS